MQYKINWREHIRRKIKLQTWREKIYKNTTNEMGRWFPGGGNRPRGLRLIVDEDYDDDDDDDDDDDNDCEIQK